MTLINKKYLGRIRIIICRFIPTQLALFGLAVLAFWPLFRAGPTTVVDGQNHFYRLAELHWALQNGAIYPRWSPDFAYGFGAPVFNFYPPLSYWGSEVWALLGLSLSRALEAGYFLALLILVTGAYMWARSVFRSEVAALATASAYVLCPYLFINLLRRGAYAELWGMALVPWVMLAALRLARHTDLRSMLAMAATVAIQILCHPLSAFMLIPFIAVYLSFMLRLDWRRWMWSGLSMILAAGLAAIYWIPAVMEERFVQMSRTVSHPMLDFHNHFLSVSELLASPYVLDTLRIYMPIQPSLSWIVIALAMLGWWSHRSLWSIHGIGVIALIMAFLVTGASLPVWEVLPRVSMIQFPWRFLGPLSLAAAMLAGGGVAAIRQFWALPLFVIGVALFSMGWMFGYPATSLEGKTHRDIHSYERTTGLMGSTVFGEFLTVWMHELPSSDVLLENFMTSDLPPPRLDVVSLPQGVRVLDERPRFDSTSVEYQSDVQFDARLHWLIFPDVQASVDDASLQVSPEAGSGLVLVSGLPAGHHTLTVSQVLSGPQRLGTVVSIISLTMMIGVLLLTRRRALVRDNHPRVWPGVSVVLVAAGLIVLRVTWLDVRPSIFHHSSFDGDLVAGSQPLAINFGSELRLLGLRVNENKNEVRLYWKPMHNLDVNYSVALYLEDREGYRYGQQDSQHPGQVPTSRWGVEQYAEDVHMLYPLPGTPPGEYRLVTGVYSEEGGLDVLSSEGPSGHYVSVGKYRVPRTRRPPTLAELAPQVTVEMRFDDFSLLGYDVDRHAVVAGTSFYVTLYWQATRATSHGLPLEIVLKRSNELVTSVKAPLTTRTSDWYAGEIGRGPQRVMVPAGTLPGRVTILLRFDGGELRLGEIEVLD